ncbi:SUMF1/EgtB/PvdO family nonheme iron enzyme [Gimesia sp.]|uniref:SUMF1/EgtB/PvdO family nonheme iron enzyme n=1 Tax=Gimesia sp. TaxID=2024833 RepID=UPI003A90A9CE
MNQDPPDLQRFISNQQLSLLECEPGDNLLTAIQRLEARLGPGQSSPLADRWQAVEDRHAFFQDLAAGDQSQLTVFVNAAGMGKTIISHYLEYVLGSVFHQAAIRLEAEQIVKYVGELKTEAELITLLISQFEKMGVTVTPQELRFALRQRQLILVIDALDQVGKGNLQPFFEFMRTHPLWRQCQLIVTGRPPAINREWDQVFRPELRNWQFVCLEPFTPEQCAAYLQGRDDAVSRYEALSESVKEVLQVPRVLSYLRFVKAATFAEIETAADVIGLALREMVRDGLEKFPDLKLNLENTDTDPISEILQGLATVAFAQTCEQLEYQDVLQPNFTRISSQDLPDFKQRLSILLGEKKVQPILNALGTLNVALRFDLLEAGSETLTEIQFQNRSLQEWLTAYYLANHTRDADRQLLWEQNWIVEWDREPSQEYREVWQFFVDLKGQADFRLQNQPGFRKDNIWLETAELLFRPCFDARTGQFYDELPADVDRDAIEWLARRSPEFIYQVWFRLEAFCELEGTAEQGLGKAERTLRERAREIRDRWQREFTAIADGQQGKVLQRVAQEHHEDFVDFPAGEVWFGSKDWDQPPSRENIPPSVQKLWAENFKHADDTDEKLRAWLLDVQYQWLKQQPASTQKKNLEDLMSLIRDEEETWKWLASQFSRTNERTADGANPLPVSAFGMQRCAVTNARFRLFSPEHGLRGDYDYQGVSREPDCPSLYIDWYTAWVYCQWCFWDETPCRLPQEHEFEYAVKFGMLEADQLAWDYWWAPEWGDEKETHKQCHGNHAYETGTVPADPRRASDATEELDPKGVGVMDLLGNQQEWMGNEYQEIYAGNLTGPQERVHPITLMSCRGGAWLYLPFDLRATRRDRDAASSHDFGIGFRILRTK